MRKLRLATSSRLTLRVLAGLRRYCIEGFFSATLMICITGTLLVLEHPASPLNHFISAPWMRRLCMGAAIGTVVALIIQSPWGQRTGAHFNPAVTLAFWSLDRIRAVDAAGYVAAQLVGACGGMVASSLIAGDLLAVPQIDYGATHVGDYGVAWAFFAEFAMSFLLMASILALSSRPKWSRFVAASAGALIALFIAVEAPVSGMSLNPARTLGSAVVGGGFARMWLYCLAPVGGMLSAAGGFRRWQQRRPREQCLTPGAKPTTTTTGAPPRRRELRGLLGANCPARHTARTTSPAGLTR